VELKIIKTTGISPIFQPAQQTIFYAHNRICFGIEAQPLRRHLDNACFAKTGQPSN
jgi:hypothetical protein